MADHWVSGINADAISSHLTTQSADELMRAERCANRIMELGEEPVMNFTELPEVGGCGYKAPPKEQSDLKQIIQDVIDAERCAIGFYNKMTDKYKDKDYVTHELFKAVLLDEVSDEEEWEDLLAQQP
ncbi:MAG: ferritin-like domain-containing protein [Nitrosopumilus sp.]